MKKFHLSGASRTCILIAGFLLTTTVNAMLINIDFGPNGSAPYDGQGILGNATETYWNAVNSSGATNLKFADGTAGTVEVTVTLGSTISNQGTNALLGDRILGGVTEQQTISFLDLTPDTKFDIVLYNSYYGQEYSIVDQSGIGTASTLPTENSRDTDFPNWTEGVEYAWLHSAMSDGSGLLQINGLPINGAFWGETSAIAGLQIQEVTAVPIPPAVWLFGSGLLGLVGLARRKKAA